MTFTTAIILIVTGYVLMLIFTFLMSRLNRHGKIAHLLPLLLAFACATFSISGTIALSTRPTEYVVLSSANPASYTPIEDQDGCYLYRYLKYNCSEFHIYEWDTQKNAWTDVRHTINDYRAVPILATDSEKLTPTVYSYDELLLGIHKFLFWNIQGNKAAWTTRYYFRIPENRYHIDTGK